MILLNANLFALRLKHLKYLDILYFTEEYTGEKEEGVLKEVEQSSQKGGFELFAESKRRHTQKSIWKL